MEASPRNEKYAAAACARLVGCEHPAAIREAGQVREKAWGDPDVGMLSESFLEEYLAAEGLIPQQIEARRIRIASRPINHTGKWRSCMIERMPNSPRRNDNWAIYSAVTESSVFIICDKHLSILASCCCAKICIAESCKFLKTYAVRGSAYMRSKRYAYFKS